MHRASANKSPSFRWALLPAALIAACGGSETTSSTAHDGGSGSAGSAGSARGGTAGATGSSGEAGSIGSAGSAGTSITVGTGGSAGIEGGMANIRSPRRCGHGVPCAPGAECAVAYIESGLDCECDSSGHFFCDAWAGGGAPSQPVCPRRTGCSGSGGSDDGSCSLTNGYCTRTCVCPSGTCTTDCSGSGPPASEGELCDPSHCQVQNRYRCEVKDGSCDYSVECRIGEPTIVSGRCD
jgi:hypothetical protein